MKSCCMIDFRLMWTGHPEERWILRNIIWRCCKLITFCYCIYVLLVLFNTVLKMSQVGDLEIEKLMAVGKTFGLKDSALKEFAGFRALL